MRALIGQQSTVDSRQSEAATRRAPGPPELLTAGCRLWTVIAAMTLVAGCSAQVVFSEDGDGGGGSGASGAGANASGPNTSTGPTMNTTVGTLCSSHAQCPELCDFATGECILACNRDGGCDNGLFCNACATSSCPKCNDCVAGCDSVGTPCDDHDDCGITPGEDVCVFSLGVCAQRCGPGSPPCPPALLCEECATSSCPGCRDCVGACLQGFE